MTVTIVVGAQWGDEGKGKIVDLLSEQADLVVRSAGGANAGHTLKVDGETLITHLVPSGILWPGVACILGPGMVLDLDVLATELSEALSRGLLDDASRIKVSLRAHVIFPFHRKLEEVRERGSQPIGTTKRGIGPAYQFKAARLGIRVHDLFDSALLRDKFVACAEMLNPLFAAQDLGEITDGDINEWLAWAAKHADGLKDHVISVSDLLAEEISAGRDVLLEGAQGALLDWDFGTYPFVTSSATTAAGACQGAGIGPTVVDRVIGIVKAYTTRVGEGPFPTALSPNEDEELRQRGGEFGATTGRPRRCGWLDLVALRHAVRVGGITELALTKADILSGFRQVKVCTSYEHQGTAIDTVPTSISELEAVVPKYQELAPWGDLQAFSSWSDMSVELATFIKTMEDFVGVPVTILSVGPERSQTIFR